MNHHGPDTGCAGCRRVERMIESSWELRGLQRYEVTIGLQHGSGNHMVGGWCKVVPKLHPSYKVNARSRTERGATTIASPVLLGPHAAPR